MNQKLSDGSSDAYIAGTPSAYLPTLSCLPFLHIVPRSLVFLQHEIAEIIPSTLSPSVPQGLELLCQYSHTPSVGKPILLVE